MGRVALAGGLLILLAVVSAAGVPDVAATAPEAVAAQAEELLRDPEALALSFLADRQNAARVLPLLATALDLAPDDGSGTVARGIAELGRALSRRLAEAGPPWSDDLLDLLLTTLLVHPLRFVEEPGFRQRVAESILPWALDPSVPPELRDRLLDELHGVRGVGFELSERVELAWGTARRASAERQLASSSIAGAWVADHGEIEASVLSLPSRTIAIPEAETLLAALERLAADRQLLVLSDGPLIRELAGGSRGARTHLLDTHGWPFSPWPRDALLIASRWARPGVGPGVLLIARPNRQAGREADGELARELVQQLPDALDRAWGGVRWTVAEVPFHNGQILLADGAVWVSLHSLEQPILQRLGLDRVPVAWFATASGEATYLAAARLEGERLATLFARPVHFVHGLPAIGDLEPPGVGLERLAGGAGFDLDTLLTFVPAPDGGPATALVADLDLGLALLSAGGEGIESLRRTYGIAATTEATRRALVELASSPRGRRLDTFLEVMARHLSAATVEGRPGRRVVRLPLLLAPTNLLSGEPLGHDDFLLSWNNVVVSQVGSSGSSRAEGFASGLPPGDQLARRVFGDAGVELVLLPPLTASIVRNGGYRCASNHLLGASKGERDDSEHDVRSGGGGSGGQRGLLSRRSGLRDFRDR